MNYQPDPPQPFSFDGRLALLIKMGIPETPIYRTYVQITYVWQGEATNLDVLRKTGLISRRSTLMPHLRRVVGGQEALNLQIQPHHYVIRHFKSIFVQNCKPFFLMHTYYACHDQHEHH